MPKRIASLLSIILVTLVPTRAAPSETVRVTPIAITSAGPHELADPPILRFRCSGVALDNRTIATAAHCLDGGVDAIHVASGGLNLCTGRWSYVAVDEVLHLDERADLAILGVVEDIVSGYGPNPQVPLNGSVAVGWQQASRTSGLQCQIQEATLVDVACGGIGSSQIRCYESTDPVVVVCSGLSGSPILDQFGVVAVISESDGCGQGAMVRGASLPDSPQGPS